jgi:hypothetical protein
MQVTTYTAMSPGITFLYPESRQYPVDQVCEKIVRALEKRNWKIDGIEVEFTDLGTGEEKYRRVSKIEGENFKLWFCRTQKNINPDYNDISAISEISIPRRKLCVYSDESGPSYYTYVDNKLTENKEIFL